MMIGIKKQVPQLKITANIASLIKQMNQQHAYKKKNTYHARVHHKYDCENTQNESYKQNGSKLFQWKLKPNAQNKEQGSK